MKKYRVLLSIDVEGKVYGFGDEAELTDEQATAYGHALIAIEEEADGGNQ